MAKKLVWVENPGQRIWLAIAALFALFYFGEAVLFWEPNPRIHAAAFTPLVYWGAFGAAIIWLVNRHSVTSVSATSVVNFPRKMRSTIMGIGITASVVGMPFLVIRMTGNLTLGHAILLGAMFEAAIVIGGMSGSLGWLAAGMVWAASAFLVFAYPRFQDVTIGLAVAAGFAVVGVLRKCASPGV